MIVISRFLYPGLGFTLTVLFGLWLSRVGKPYNGILFNIHKLIALGTVIVAGRQVYQTLYFPDVAVSMTALLAVAVICIVVLFASGALMSIETAKHNVMKTIHAITPILLALAVVTMLYLSGGG